MLHSYTKAIILVRDGVNCSKCNYSEIKRIRCVVFIGLIICVFYHNILINNLAHINFLQFISEDFYYDF